MTEPTTDAMFAIVFDDADRRPVFVLGEAAARARFAEFSLSWNAHLFVKVESNSRDDRYYQNNASITTDPAPNVVIASAPKKVAVTRACKAFPDRDCMMPEVCTNAGHCCDGDAIPKIPFASATTDLARHCADLDARGVVWTAQPGDGYTLIMRHDDESVATFNAAGELVAR